MLTVKLYVWDEFPIRNATEPLPSVMPIIPVACAIGTTANITNDRTKITLILFINYTALEAVYKYFGNADLPHLSICNNK